MLVLVLTIGALKTPPTPPPQPAELRITQLHMRVDRTLLLSSFNLVSRLLTGRGLTHCALNTCRQTISARFEHIAAVKNNPGLHIKTNVWWVDYSTPGGLKSQT